MKEDRAAAIHLQIEIASADIGAGRKEELDAAVPADTLLISCGHGPDISVLDPEQHEDRRGVIGQFYLRFREVHGPFPHMVAKPLCRDIPPGRGIPRCCILDRSAYLLYLAKHMVVFGAWKNHPEWVAYRYFYKRNKSSGKV